MNGSASDGFFKEQRRHHILTSVPADLPWPAPRISHYWPVLATRESAQDQPAGQSTQDRSQRPPV
jgi:hypothetical protein